MESNIQIPTHWKIDRIKNIGSVNGRVGWKALKASEYVDEGFFFLSTPNIKDIEIDFTNVNYITAERYFESPEIMLQINDVLLVKDGSTLGIVNVIKNLPSEGTVNSSIAVLRFKNQNSVFIYYFLNSNFIQEIIQLKKDGMGVPHLFQKDINNFEIFLPPLPEQTAIANYLDLKTSTIDKKTELLNQKIETYKKLRKAIINKAVTKGLDNKVELKDSEIDWIGKIPKHWEVKRVKDVFNTISGGTPSTKEKEFWSGDFPWIPSGKVQNNEVTLECVEDYISEDAFSGTKIASPNSILIALTGATCSNIGYLHFETAINQSIVAMSKKKNLFERFYFYFLISGKEKIRTLMTGGAQGGINQEDVKFFDIVYPTYEEQRQIADYLDQKTATIDKIVANLQTQIATLQHLRKVLINDAVTGKIKVV
ncbi:restriction endonuclease subunit S [Chryseobacterium sp. RR2-3-20]|uniref:restriction endonuclease subunit S n=1 Tax=Chryseobacterium sp. RR2-3-20 TaxID=2787626 RepID=UPI001ADF0BD3|nr:restriction endonuclease subunit S [Chryseobacterium sp. RR2-3-20]